MPNLKLFPSSRLLRVLVDGSLNQSQNLVTAMRRWGLISWFYGDKADKAYLHLKGGLTFNQWSQEFFKLQPPLESGHPQGQLLEKNDEILKPHNPLCCCYQTTKDWLLFYECPVDEWEQDLQKNISISTENLNKLLKERLFARIRKTLQTDINFLKDKECLKFEYSASKRQNEIYRVEKLPSWVLEEILQEKTPDATILSEFSPQELADLAHALDMLTFLDPKLAPIADRISPEVSGSRRVFLHVDYVVPESIQIDADNLQEKLEENWRSDSIKPILFNYSSHRLGNRKCVVYPVCIYYVQRAKYLCAYGLNPDGDINWYNYRLERIKLEQFLDWNDAAIPKSLLEKYHSDRLPQPEDVQEEMRGVWGFDFHNPSCLMLLRFDRNFHDRYIKDTFRHETFTRIKSQKQIAELIKRFANSEEEEKQIVKILQKFPNDAYYTAMYRVNDNNVIMRLRAWGANVEVLLPGDLRERMAQDVKEMWKLYVD